MFITHKEEITDFSGEHFITEISSNFEKTYRSVNVFKSFENLPVNIDLVTYMKKRISEFRSAVPDLMAYTIEFMFNNDNVIWYYKTEEERNTAFNEILKIGKEWWV